MTDRCEPPAELRGVEGYHWLQHGDAKPAIHAWYPDRHTTYPKYYAPGNWQIGVNDLSAAQAHAWGWRYCHPVSPHDPAAVAALVTAAQEVISDIMTLGYLPGPPYEHLARALAAFPQPKDTRP